MVRSTTAFVLLSMTGMLGAQDGWRQAVHVSGLPPEEIVQSAAALDQHPAVPHKQHTELQAPPATPQLDHSVASPSEDAKAKEAAAVIQLGAAVEKIGKNLTIFTGDEEIKLIVGGVLSADFYYNRARPVAPGIPFFLTPVSPFGFGQDTFDANARATTLFGLVRGPMICDFESGALVAVCLFNDALVVDRYGILPIQAWAELKNDEWRVAAGLQFNVFNPINPTMLEFSFLAGSGNSGMGFPGQFRVERFLHPSPNDQVTFAVAFSEPVPTTVSDQLRLNEDAGFPNVEARAAWAAGAILGDGAEAKRPFEIGLSGVLGRIRTTQGPDRRIADVWGAGADLRWALTPCYGIQAEVFAGQTLGAYTAGILQNTNAETFAGIHAAGGWIEGYWYWVPEKLHSHVGYGIDDPLDADLAPGQPIRNEVFFANLIWQVSKHLRVGGELVYRRTSYTVVGNNDGVGFHVQAQYKF